MPQQDKTLYAAFKSDEQNIVSAIHYAVKKAYSDLSEIQRKQLLVWNH